MLYGLSAELAEQSVYLYVRQIFNEPQSEDWQTSRSEGKVRGHRAARTVTNIKHKNYG
jgi:hypothetical protein